MKTKTSVVQRLVRAILPVLAAGAMVPAALGQAPATRPGPTTINAAKGTTDHLKGRLIQDVRVVGNTSVSTAAIRNVIRSREGEKYDPTTVAEDYQRVYNLRKFGNVIPLVEETATGVIISFRVFEQQPIKSITLQGNASIEENSLREQIDIKIGESLDRFRINLARQNIERVYRDRNFPFAHVESDDAALSRGELIFRVTEGPMVRVRKVQILGNVSFSDDTLKDKIKTASYILIFRAGTYDHDQITDDVAAIQQWYEQHGFFEARVGRKLTWSTDLTEVMVTFVISEGPRYKVDKVVFKGASAVTEADLRRELKMVEGRYWDAEVLRRDLRQVVRVYSPLGYIYQPTETDPERNRDYLRVEPKPILQREGAGVTLVYEITEGKPFRIGNIRVRGNDAVQDKVFVREMRVFPGQLYNAGEIQDALDRIKSTRLVNNVTVTPIGDAQDQRDLLIEVQETRTGILMFGAGITSSAGLLGNISFEQRNFDITNVPSSWSEAFSNKAFTGAGQYFRIMLEPGTEQSRARITFEEPWIFDQPFSFRSDIYYSTRQREDWEETRGGLNLSLGHRFDYTWSARMFVRGEDVFVNQVQDRPRRALEVLELEGHSTLTSVGASVRRDTTNSRIFPTRGSTTDFSWEFAGALGGDFEFHKFQFGWNYYQTVNEDLLDRKTVLSYRLDAGYITGDAPFFERFYAGGISSLRGFRYRGVSPRSGPDDDPVGGNFSLTGSVELNFPIWGETLRGVVFADAGTVESDFRIGTIRTSVGLGIRLTLPIFGQLPLALDLGVPITKDDQDDPRLISFSLGFVQ